MRKLKVFISYCSADQAIKDELAEKIGELAESYKDKVEIKIVSMDQFHEPSWDEWMTREIKECDLIIPILTESSMNECRAGETKKRVYDEVRTARDENKQMIPLAFCDIADGMRAHIGSYTAVGSIERAVGQLKYCVSCVAEGRAFSFVENASFEGLEYARTNTNFVGRESDLKWLEEHLDKRNVVILTGDGGIGKTTLAECFFQTHKDKYSVAYIVDASNGIRRSIIDLPLKTRHIKDENERYIANKRLLATQDEKTIIIFDNCDVEISGKELDDLVDKLRCRFIITSRVGDDGFCEVDRLTVGAMPNEELLQLVLRHNPSVYNQVGKSKSEVERDLFKFFDKIGGHTMTVEMASAIMENAWVSLEEITKQLFECKDTATTRKFEREQTIKQNLEKLYNFAVLSDEERRILNTLCLISPSVGMEFSELKALLGLNDANATRSLIKNTFAKQAKITKRIYMHPLLADVYYGSEMVHKTEEYQTVAKHIASLDSDDADLDKNREALLQCLYFTENRLSDLADKKLAGDMYNTIGKCFIIVAEYTRAFDYFKKALEIYLEVYKENPNHPSIAESYNNLGSVYHDLSEYETAKDYYEKALEIKMEVYKENPNHPSIARSYNNLGCVYYDLSEHETAKEYYEKALEIYLEVYKENPNHPSIARSYNNLGNVYYDLSEHKTAKDYYEKALEIYLVVYKETPNHPSIAESYNNLGSVYHDLDEYETAKGYYEKALEIYLEAYKENSNHPSIATLYNNLAEVHRSLGEHKTAKDYYEKALESYLEVYKENPNHPSIAMSYMEIAFSYHKLGEHEIAIEYYKKAKEITGGGEE